MEERNELESLKIKESKTPNKKNNKKKKIDNGFKKEYIPVIGLSILLVFLVVGLVFVFNYEKDDYEIDLPEEDVKVVEKVVDTSDSMCSEKEVNNLYQTANKVSIKYEPVKKVVGEGIDMETGEKVKTLGYVQKVEIRNLSDDVYVIIDSNNKLSKQHNLKLTSGDAKDGVLTYFTEYTNDLITYTIRVYSSKGDCVDELFREFEFKTPIYNRYSAMDICKNYPNFKYCQKYIEEDRPTQEQFQVALAAYQKENKVTTNNAGEIIDSKLEEHQELIGKDVKEEKDNDYLMYILIGGAVLILIVTVIAIVLVTKKKGDK